MGWCCVENCGACCHLDPKYRPDLASYLTPEQLKLYLSLVGEGGWCINFDHQTRKCLIYDQRPQFCRVEFNNFHKMYGIKEEEFDDFAIDCCEQQITGVYGDPSKEMEQYQRAVTSN